MATRNERVVLTLDDQFSGKMARAAAATAVLNRQLHDLDGTSTDVGDGMDRTSDSIKRSGDESRKSAPDIDKFSGRLRTLVDIGITAGPALIPLGASTIPVLTGAIAGLGAAAGGLGVTILAFQGLGDAIKALDAYRLEPTAQNLEKLRIEQEKLGPAGADFARYIANLEPTLRNVQNIARAGLFPGVEAGIDSFLQRGPQVERIIADIAEGLGGIARDAGDGLASDKFTPFFDYIESDARPTMEAFAASTGNVALGIANMIVAFAPLSRDFTGGLEDATRAFADWSATLGDNESFQGFVDYIRESGPQAIAFFGSLIQAITGLLQAAAPIGSIVLPALTQILDLFADIAQSDAGPALYAAAAGLIAFNRASAVTARYGPRVAATFAGINAATVGKSAAAVGLLALSMSDLDDKAGATNTTMGAFAGLVAAGPLGAAVGASVGAFLDLKKASDDFTASVEHAQDVLRNGDTSDMRNELVQLQAEYAKTQALLDPKGFVDNIKAFALGSSLGGSAFLGVQADGAYKLKGAIDELGGGMKQGGTLADLFAHDLGLTATQFKVASGAADDFSGALARLNGWFDKREAVRGYRDAIDTLRESLKNGFTREDAANLDSIGRSILQVAQNIKNPGARANFLAEARGQLVDMANNAAPKAKAAIREVIAQFDDKGLTHPKIEITADDRRARATIDPLKQDLTIMGRSITEPKIGANDNPFRQTYGTVKGALREADNLRATPRIAVNPGNSLDILSQIRNGVANLVSKTITITVKRVGAALPQFDTGGFTGPGRKHDVAGIVHAGEVVIPQERVKRDWSMLKARYGDLPGFASGGVVGGSDDGDPAKKRRPPRPVTSFYSPEIADLLDGAKGAANALHILNQALRRQEAALKKSEKALDKETSKRDEIANNMAALNSSVQSKFGVDLGAKPSNPWAAGGSGIQGQIAQATSQAQALPGIIAALQAAGLTGPALQQALQEMDFTQLQALAANPSQAGQLGSSLSALYAAQSTAGGAAGSAVYGAAYDAQVKIASDQLAETKGLRGDVKRLEAAVKQADDANRRGHEKNAEDVTDGVNGAATKGRDRGPRRAQQSFGRLQP